jgi:hypothetical protein
MNIRAFGLAVVAANVLAVSAWAHHSHGNYQMTEYRNLTGIVKQIHFVNPHSWLYIEVTDESGEPAMWALETASAGGLNRQGINNDLIKVGDEISTRCHQLRDGSNGCLLGFLTTTDGIEREWD